MRDRNRLARGLWAPVLILLTVTLGTSLRGLAQESVDKTPQADDLGVPDEAAQPVEVVVVGASVSKGFECPWSDQTGRANRTVPLKRALAAVWDKTRFRIRDCSDLLTFLDPIGRQATQTKRGRRSEPELVFAIDFMFWFGYGRVAGGTDGRLALQKKGFEFLEAFGDVPMVIGDYPDMTGADPRMLQKSQIPTPTQIQLLNSGLHTWAEGRENVVVFPLGEWVATMKTEGRKVQIDGEVVQLKTVDLMQTDLLHASKLGMALLVQGLGEIIEPMDARRFAVPEGVTFESIVDGIRATTELEEALEPQLETAGK